MGYQGHIQTGIDKLVTLVAERKSIPLHDAAKELGLSSALIEEWANFLEEEGILEFNYKLTGVRLVAKNISKPDIKNNIDSRKKEIKERKSLIVDKIKQKTGILDSTSKDISDVKKKLDSYLGKLESDFGHIKDDVTALKKLEDLYDALDSEVISHEHDFKMKVKKINEVLKRESDRYNRLVSEIKRKDNEIIRESKEIESLRKQEMNVMKNLANLEKFAKKIESAIDEKSKNISKDFVDLDLLKRTSDDLKTDIVDHRDKLNDLVKQKEEKEKQIESRSSKIVGALESKTQDIREGMKELNKIKAEFSDLFEKKNRFREFISDSGKDSLALKQEMESLLEDAERLNVVSNAVDVKSLAKDIKKAYSIFAKKHKNAHKNYKGITEKLHKKVAGKKSKKSKAGSKPKKSRRSKTGSARTKSGKR